MQKKSVRGAVVALAAGAALLAAPVTAQAAGLPLEPAQPAPAAPNHAAPVDSIFNTNSASSMSSQTTSTFACLLQSVSAQVDCPMPTIP